ncbi:MAG TPA: NosD domain-containing protein [Sedimentisphaerales bacterium]|nr:NosD domain-containing protein [Sedimentisphaerales bacterium]
MNNSSRKRLVDWRLLAAVAALVCCGSAAFAYNIPSDTTIGTWDSVSRVYTLTGDVSGSIVVDESNLTLDGAGYTVTGSGSGNGIFLYNRTGVTVENVTVQGFETGIYLALAPGNVLTCNTLSSNNPYGIWLDYSSNNTLNGNTASGSHEGIRINNGNGNTVMENTMSGNDNGITLVSANNNQVYSNNFIANTTRQAYVTGGSGNVFNLATGGNYWSDWSGSGPYVFDGGQDDMPLADPVAVSCGVLVVAIDIKPGSYPNPINLGSYGLIPVAILSTAEFDATTVDPETVELAGAGVAVRGKSNKYMAQQEDVNGDGLLDLVNHVATENLDPNALQDGYAVLTGKTFGGEEITGTDEITIVPPE